MEKRATRAMTPGSPEDLDRRRRLAQLAYALQAAGLLVGIPYLVAAIISQVQRPKVAGTWLESHFRWQNNTFWFSLVIGGLALAAGPIGIMIISGDLMWIVFRIVQGWVKLTSGLPVGQSST
jgi:uncharacterized membrane protein